MAEHPGVDDVPAGYPAEWETHAVLRDGVPVVLRPIRPSDRDQLDAFHERQSPESIYLRYFGHRPSLTDAELDFFTRVDYDQRMAFVALLSDELVAVARYEHVAGTDRPELSFFVDDRHQGRGLATLMLEYLAAAARSRGLTGFVATVLPENHAMLRVFKRAGFTVTTSFDHGVIAVDLDITLTAETSSAIADRQIVARSRSVARLLAPTAVAVVGAGRTPGTVGHELYRQLLAGGFTGELYPINHAASEVLGHRAWPSLTALDRPVDLAIVAVPANGVESVVEQAARASVGGLLIVTSGFSDAGPEGLARERELVAVARSNGMRVIGPNAFGLVNTAPAIALRALFLPASPEAGPVAVFTQSGPLGGALLEQMRAAGAGLSSFVAAGNRADVSVNDVLDYWLTDDATEIVLLYVENYGNLRTFAETARTVSTRKPIVALRPPDGNLVELLEQSGVVLVDGVAEMADLARLVADQPLPAGHRVVVVSNAASVARLVAASCRRCGLEPVVPAGVAEGMAAGSDGADTLLVGDVDTVTLTAAGRQPDYERVLVAAAASADVDAVLVALVPTLELSVDELASVLERVNASIDKPVLVTDLAPGDRLTIRDVPVFEFPEEAARALGHLADYARWRRANTTAATGGGDAERIAALAQRIRPGLLQRLGSPDRDQSGEDGPVEVEISMLSPAAPEVIASLGIPVAPWRVVGSAGELRPAAESIGYPVVLKAGGVPERRVGEAGGAAIDLHDLTQLQGAFDRMLAARGPSMLPALVQAMVPSTADVECELVQDPDLGAFVRLGLGGAAGHSLPAAVRRFLPLSGADAESMVDGLVETVPMDVTSRRVLAGIVKQVADVGAAVPELARVTLDPVLIAGDATATADVSIWIRSWRRDPLAEVRRL